MLGVRCEAACRLTRLGITGVRCEALGTGNGARGVVCESLSGRDEARTTSGEASASSWVRSGAAPCGPERSSGADSSRSDIAETGSAPSIGAILGVTPEVGGGGRLIPDGPDCGRLLPDADGTKALSCCSVAAT